MYDPDPTGRFLTRTECSALVQRAKSFSRDQAQVYVGLTSSWTGNLRWARNRVISSGDVRDNSYWLACTLRGAVGKVMDNQIDDVPLRAAVRRAELLMSRANENPEWNAPSDPPFIEPILEPKLWYDASFSLSGEARGDVMQRLVAPAEKAGLRAAGYIQVAGACAVVMDSTNTLTRYYPFTTAQYSVTVRDPEGTGSGWAGVDWNDWMRIDTQKLSDIALDKCLRSRNPVRVEPGRYTAILEPQAVSDLCTLLFNPFYLDREWAELKDPRNPQRSNYFRSDVVSPFGGTTGRSKIGERVIDDRITVRTDPMDPDLGFVPFDDGGGAFHPVTWIEHGVLKALAYYRHYAVQRLGLNTGGIPANNAFKMSADGPNTGVSIDEMIATTKRGIVVTRLSQAGVIDVSSVLATGYTRDGLWLVENGKITKPIKNFRFTESPFFVLNSIDQIGVPQRVFHPEAPVVVPALKVRDFSFTAISDAV